MIIFKGAAEKKSNSRGIVTRFERSQKIEDDLRQWYTVYCHLRILFWVWEDGRQIQTDRTIHTPKSCNDNNKISKNWKVKYEQWSFCVQIAFNQTMENLGVQQFCRGILTDGVAFLFIKLIPFHIVVPILLNLHMPVYKMENLPPIKNTFSTH